MSRSYGLSNLFSWDAWTSNCGTAVKLPPYNDQLRSVLPSYALGTPSGGSKFVDPRAPNNPPPPQTPPPPITPTPPPGPTTTSVPTSKPNDDDDTTSASNSSSGSLSGSSSGSSVSSTATNTDSSTDSSTSTLTSPASSRPSGGGVATGTAGFSADPNDPNNPSPSISPLDGSSNSGNGALAERKGNNAGAIVGGVIGAIAFLILLGGAIYWFRTRRRRGSLAPSAAYMAAYGRPETVMSQRPYTDRSNTPLHSIYPEAHSPYSDDLRESVHSYNMEGVTGYNGPQRNISPQQYSPTR
ncbi:hypothetical protein BJ165DRAFT_1400518 [Panaeolus papilionaceus]|nr:hypothetical protein BJ165DRAFT_1400518 [Panaeolus papilionaceus]